MTHNNWTFTVYQSIHLVTKVTNKKIKSKLKHVCPSSQVVLTHTTINYHSKAEMPHKYLFKKKGSGEYSAYSEFVRHPLLLFYFVPEATELLLPVSLWFSTCYFSIFWSTEMQKKETPSHSNLKIMSFDCCSLQLCRNGCVFPVHLSSPWSPLLFPVCCSSTNTLCLSCGKRQRQSNSLNHTD